MPRFTATPETILSHLSATMGHMHGETTNWIVRFGGKVSIAYAKNLTRMGVGVEIHQPDLYPLGAAIGFTRKGVAYAFSCESYESTWDNFRATQQAISWSWRIYENYGVKGGAGHNTLDSFDRVFIGHRVEPLALAAGWQNWWEVIGIAREESFAAVEREYRRKMRLFHPDNKETGSAYMASALNQALDKARAEKGT